MPRKNYRIVECVFCNLPMEQKRASQKLHLECVSAWKSKQAADKVADIRGLFAPKMVGRSLDDPRNDPKNNKARQAGESTYGPIRQAIFDIETSSLNAGFGRVLCAVIQLYDPNDLVILRADQYAAWKDGRRSDDKELVADILSVLAEADIVIAHNGLKFDMPFLRTRAVIHGLPPVNFQKIIDPVLMARQHFRWPYNSLDMISGLINSQHQKTPLNPTVWARAIGDGDKECMDLIVEHCIADVKVLEEVIKAVKGYVRKIDISGSFRA